MYEFLQEKGKNFPLLYVEDNEGLGEKALRFFKKFFGTVYYAKNGEEGLEFFKKYQPKLIVTDIKMPKLNGLEMIKKIKLIDPDVKVIVTTAHDDKEFLLEAIEIGIFRYVSKPFNIQEITGILEECFIEIDKSEKQDTFNQNIKEIFDYQENLIILLEKDVPIIANYNFLKFFNINEIKEFSKTYPHLSNAFLEEENFLYGDDSLKTIKKNPTSLQNVKMKKDNKFLHFILKAKKVPNREDEYIYSFSDITALGILKTFVAKNKKDKNEHKEIIILLKIIMEHKANVKIHNYYKGLSITNDAQIISATDGYIKIKTSFLQVKALQEEKLFLISSDFLPKNIMCKQISSVNDDEESVISNDYHFVDTSYLRRKYVRVMPENAHKAVVYSNLLKLNSEIIDISIKFARIRLKSKPPEIKINKKVKINLLLGKKANQFLVQSNSTITRIQEVENKLDIVVEFDISENTEELLTEYIFKRQLTLIKEFKALHVDDTDG